MVSASAASEAPTAASDPVRAVAAWSERPDPRAFPYDAVVAEFHRVGKHFVEAELLETLDGVRARVPERCPVHRELARFLATTLDKFDGRYDNPSYLALEQLSLPGADGPRDDAVRATRRRDRLTALLLADVLRAELAAADGRCGLRPELRPGARTVEKRCRHALRAIRPALERLGVDGATDEEDPIAAARRVSAAVFADADAAELRTLKLTSLHVSQVHDEYMFMRTLQAYETTFALVSVLLEAAIATLGRGDATEATKAIEAAGGLLGEASPLFSLLGTMQVDAFLRFREFTDGASAIQSRNYKLFESLCRRPDQGRLDSPAYHSVPEVREVVVAGQPNLDDALAAASAAGLLTRTEQAGVCAAMRSFQDAVFKWRRTHHSLAARMLGERRGTGYTAGVAYLEAGKSIPLFESCPMGFGAGAEREAHAPPATCPVAKNPA